MPIVSSAATSVALRPMRSPKWPNTAEPTGRAKNAIANVASDCRVAAQALRYTKGRPHEYRSSPRVLRAFCGQCGTPLSWRHDDAPGEVDVTICSLDDPDAVAPWDHTFVASGVRWLHLADGLPRYPRSRSEGNG